MTVVIVSPKYQIVIPREICESVGTARSQTLVWECLPSSSA